MAEGDTPQDDAGPNREMLNLIDSRIALAASNAARPAAAAAAAPGASSFFDQGGEETESLFDDTDALFNLPIFDEAPIGWVGWGMVGNRVYADPDSNSYPGSLYYNITDNSASAKLWLKVTLSAAAGSEVTYETNGPAANTIGEDQVYFYVPQQTTPFYVQRTG